MREALVVSMIVTFTGLDSPAQMHTFDVVFMVSITKYQYFTEYTYTINGISYRFLDAVIFTWLRNEYSCIGSNWRRTSLIDSATAPSSCTDLELVGNRMMCESDIGRSRVA